LGVQDRGKAYQIESVQANTTLLRLQGLLSCERRSNRSIACLHVCIPTPKGSGPRTMGITTTTIIGISCYIDQDAVTKNIKI
jgi:hypothetical protein